MQADLRLSRCARHALKLIEALLQRRLAGLRDVVVMLGAVEDAADFLAANGLGVEAAAGAEGKFMSAFIRASRPVVQAGEGRAP